MPASPEMMAKMQALRDRKKTKMNGTIKCPKCNCVIKK